MSVAPTRGLQMHQTTPFSGYRIGGSYDEMFSAPGAPRPHYGVLHRHLLDLPDEQIRRRKSVADQSFLHQGITFTVYGKEEGTERIFPHDLVPRIITSWLPRLDP